MDSITVLVVDDHLLFAEAVAARLAREPDMTVLAPVGTAERARATLAAGPVDVMLLDVALGADSGLDVLAHVRANHPGTRAVMLTATGTVEAAVAAVRHGARAWVSKTGDAAALVSVIRGVLRDEAYLPPHLLGGVLRELTGTGGVLDTMTTREREILQCLVDGLSRAEIAARLYLSVNTVRTHTQNLFGKLGVHAVLEAVAMAMQAGMRPRASESAS